MTVTCDDCGEVITNETLLSLGGHNFKDGCCVLCKQELAEAIDLNDDNKVSALDAQLLAEAEAELRTLSDEQWTALGDICVQDIIDYILGRHPGT